MGGKRGRRMRRRRETGKWTGLKEERWAQGKINREKRDERQISEKNK